MYVGAAAFQLERSQLCVKERWSTVHISARLYGNHCQRDLNRSLYELIAHKLSKTC